MPRVIVNSGYIKSSTHFINYLEYAGNKLEAQTLILNDGTEIELEPDELYDVTQSDFKYIEIKMKDGGFRRLNKYQYIRYVNNIEDGVVENKLVRNDGLTEDLEPVTYLKYIGYRPSVEKYSNASHGLFDLQGMANMNDVKQKVLENEKSIKWSHIISLKDTDAERLGYDNRQAWENLIRAKAYDISKIYNIPPEHLQIYAAFHKRDHHPHCHLFIFSNDNNSNHGFIKGGTEAFIKASERMRSVFTNEIFKDDIQSLKIDKDKYRRELRTELDKYICAVGQKDYMPHQDIVNSFSNLASSLIDYQGKASYAYLSAEQKLLVNDVLAAAISSDDNLKCIFQQLVDNQREFIALYNDDADKIEGRLQDYIDHFFKPSYKNDYRVLHNAIIKQAMLYNQHVYPPTGESVVRKDKSPVDCADKNETETQNEDVVRKEEFDISNLVKTEEQNNAIDYLKQVAARGQYTLGKLYLSEDDDLKNKNKSIEYLKLSAEQGNQYAQYKLGCICLTDEYGVEDFDAAKRYLEQSAEQGNQFAQYRLGKILVDDVSARNSFGYNFGFGLNYLKQSAEQGNQYAQYELGRIYLSEEYGVKDIVTAKRYLEQSAEQCNQFAQYTLGKIYLSDEYSGKNINAAIAYFKQAAEQNNELAQYQLGRLYYFGNDFIVPDKELGMYYLKLSAEQGNDYAENTIDSIKYRHSKEIQYSSKLVLSDLARIMALLAINNIQQKVDDENEHKKDRPKFVASGHQKSVSHFQSHSQDNSVPR